MMASLPPDRSKFGSAPEHSTQAEMHPQRKGCETDANGDGTDDETLPTPFNWEPVAGVVGPPYMDYQQIIIKERAPDLFPSPPKMSNVVSK